MRVVRVNEQDVDKVGYRHTSLPPGGSPLSTFATGVGLVGTGVGFVLWADGGEGIGA